jgi:uncharacterized protein (DUF58 family)
MPGDDLKRIDWKVLGRTDKYYIRRYQDETNLRVYLLIDRSGSMNYTSGEHPTKFSYACTLAAALGYVVLKATNPPKVRPAQMSCTRSRSPSTAAL